jgi:hypothetical protein
MMERKKREKTLTFEMPNAAIYVTPLQSLGWPIAPSEFWPFYYSACTTLALTLFYSPPYTQTHISVKETRHNTSGGLFHG